MRTSVHRLPSHALDCLQTSFALFADDFHGEGVALRLGARFSFRPDHAKAPASFEPSLDVRAAEAEDLLGLRIAARHRAGQAGVAAAVAEAGGPVYVVADAFDLPWLPYHGRAHMPHSFVLTAAGEDWEVLDAYDNATQWGHSAPGTWSYRRAELEPALEGAEALEIERAPLPPLEPGTWAPDAIDEATIAAYLASFRDHEDAGHAASVLALDTWLLARGRVLGELWTGSEAMRASAEGWQAIARSVYILTRRGPGDAIPPSILDAVEQRLRADAALTAAAPAVAGEDAEDAAATGDDDDGVRRVVAEIAGEVLGLPEPERLGPDAFVRSADFDSVRLVQMLEMIEARLGLRVEGWDLAPDDLRDVDGLVRVVGRHRELLTRG